MSGAANRYGASSPQRTARLAALIHRQPLSLLAAAACLGVLVEARLGGVSTHLWIGVAVGLLAVFCFSRGTLAWLAVVALFIPIFALRDRYDSAKYDSQSILSIASTHPQPSVVDGLVDTPVVLRRHPMARQMSRRGGSPWQTQMELSIQRIRLGYEFENCSGRLLVTCDGKLDQLRPGDSIRAFGDLCRFSSATNPGQRDLRSVYRRRRLHARFHVDASDQIVFLEKQSSSMSRAVASIASGSREILLDQMEPTAGSLAVALVLGQRELVDQETRDLLLITGTAHLLSVSGLHLAIVVMIASWIATALRMPHGGKIVLLLGVCLLYTAITGARPPVVRSAVLVVAVVLSIWMRRPNQPLNTLSLAALLLVGYNPELVFSMGVQLSFLAVTTLLMCGRRLASESQAMQLTIAQQHELNALVESSYRRPIRWLRTMVRIILQMVWFSTCVTAVSLPLIWHHFHVVSPISVLANVVLGPLMFVALATGVATVMTGWIAHPLSVIPGTVCEFVLHAMRGVIDYAAEVPLGHHWLPAPPTWWVIVFYVTLGVSLWWRSHTMFWIRIAVMVAWVLIAHWICTRPAALPKGTMEATFVDVGHGTCAVLRFAEDDVWLYDCGRLGNEAGSSRDIDEALWALGVRQLQGIVLSHADADHYNALPGLLRRFSAVQIITPPGMLEKREGTLEAVRQAIRRKDIPIRELSRGDQIETALTSLQVLHPPRNRVAGSDNANSMVLRIDHAGKTLLLPGDLEPPGTRMLIDQQRPPPGGVLMAPHHGSVTRESKSILQWARPRETVVSGGRRATRMEVEQMLAITGSGVFVTAKLGAIRVRVDRDGKIELRSWRKSPW